MSRRSSSFSLWLLLFSCIPATVWALTNITVDDTSSLLTFSGDNWNSYDSSLDYGGSHRLGSSSSAYATFTFTGVAVYYVSALWPYGVNSTITVDGVNPEFVNLTDPNASRTDGGSASSSYSVHWSKTGLTNSSHDVVVSMATGEDGIWIIVDGFIYTVDDGDSSSASSTASATSSASSSSTTSSPSSGSSHTTAIAVGAAIGALVLVIAAGLAIFFWRRRAAQRKENQSWGLPPPALSGGTPLMSQMDLPPPGGAPMLMQRNSYISQTSAPSSTYPLLPDAHSQRATSMAPSSSDYNPYAPSSSASASGLGSSSTGMESGAAGMLSVSNPAENVGGSMTYINEKRGQTLALADEPLPPPAYTPSVSDIATSQSQKASGSH